MIGGCAFLHSSKVQTKIQLELHSRACEAWRKFAKAKTFAFLKQEENILDLWSQIDALHTQLALTENKPEYIFYDGPPFATGPSLRPHPCRQHHGSPYEEEEESMRLKQKIAQEFQNWKY
ncbi:Rossmann-like alpha/beta/alpha sandwich fold [Sesbania bispinosa]|nr:Rossmann-like alpha/beta/alpha sandwich fold [Sesbania bispinosa]